MAKLGTVFVELLLDDKVYKKNLSEQLISTQTTAKGIEQSWKVLGQRSDDIYNAQRRSYENALTLIKNSHNATKQDIIRAEQAAADKIKRINEQQYGHQTTMIEGLKKNWLAATAAIGAAMIVVSKEWDLAKIGAEYAEQQGILNNLSTKYKTTADEIVKAMQKASDGTVANADLMKIALGGISKGLNPEQLTELSNAAKMLADVTGETTTQALTTLSEALETGRMKALKHYAGTIDLKDAFGELTDKLTATEKAQAMYALIIQHTTELQAQQTQVVDAAADKIERMEASYNNANLAAGNFFKTVIAGIYDMAIALASAPHIDPMGMNMDNTPVQTSGTSTQLNLKLKDRANDPEAILANIKKQAEARQEAAKATEKHTKAVIDHHKAVKAQQEQLRAETGIIYNIEDSYRATEKAIEDMTEAAQEGFELTMDSIKKIEFDELKKNLKSISDSFGDLGNACMDLSSIYEEGSKSARMWEEAARAFEVAQKAVAVANAVATIANQGLGDPYTAFARIAAMAATMASFLATIGESIGSGGSTSGSTNIYHSSSKTLGTNEASESAMRSYDLLKDTYQMQYTKLSAINSELRSLNANLTGLATSIAQTGGANQFLTGRPSNKFDFMMREMFAARGIYMPSTSVGDILSGGGVDASGYMKFGRKPEYSELNPLIDKYVDQSMVDMAKLFSTMGGAFGVSNDVIGQYNIPAISMNFKGLSDEEIQQRIIRQFSDIMDTGIEDIFGDAVYTFVKGFQQIDESIGETVTRLMRNREIVSEFMTSTGVALNKTTQEAISFSESLITIAGGLDALTDAFNSFYNNFYSDSEKQINYQRQLTDIVDDFGVKTLPANREGWRDLVNSMAGVNDEAYVSFLKASDMAHEYYSYIEKAAEDAKRQRLEQITSEFEFRKAALTDRYNQQLQAAQDRLSAITEIANKLTAARERMKVQDAIIEAANFRGAKSNLMRGIWNDDSLNTLTGINPGQYSSRQDYLRDYYDIYNQLSALEQDALSKKSAAERTIDWLKSQYEIDLQNLDLQRQQAESLVVIKQVCTRTNKGLQEFDDGGIASGPSSGYEARLHGTELVISPRKGYSATVKSNNEDVVNSINELKNEVRGILVSMNNTTQKSYDIIDNWNTIGLPVEQT